MNEQQAQRRAIGDVQIVEHQQQRRARGGRAQEAPDGVVEREAGGLRGAGGVGGQAGEPGAQLGEQRRQGRRPGAQRGGQLGRLLLLDQRAQHLHPGQSAGAPSASQQRPHRTRTSGGGRPRRALVGQAGLANTRARRPAGRGGRVPAPRVGERALQRPDSASRPSNVATGGVSAAGARSCPRRGHFL